MKASDTTTYVVPATALPILLTQHGIFLVHQYTSQYCLWLLTIALLKVKPIHVAPTRNECISSNTGVVAVQKTRTAPSGVAVDLALEKSKWKERSRLNENHRLNGVSGINYNIHHLHVTQLRNARAMQGARARARVRRACALYVIVLREGGENYTCS